MQWAGINGRSTDDDWVVSISQLADLWRRCICNTTWKQLKYATPGVKLCKRDTERANVITAPNLPVSRTQYFV